MNPLGLHSLAVVVALALASTAHGAGRYLEARHTASVKHWDIQLGVTYTPLAPCRGSSASLMQTLHPQRFVAIWLRSGTAFVTWEKGEIPKPEIPDPVYQIPMMCNPGAKEKGDKRFSGAWTGSLAMFKAYRDKGAPAGFAPDPRTAHECGDSRYLAIPFFDACLAQRLPASGARDQKLRPVDPKGAWLAELHSDRAEPAASFKGQPREAVWLPNERVAKAWAEYVTVGSVSDTTPPPAPLTVKVTAGA